MEIIFEGKYKSITPFEWKEIPKFVIITGPNGTGKSQLLDLIYNTITDNPNEPQRVDINQRINANEVTILKGEWQLQNTGNVNLYTLQQHIESHYTNFKQGNYTQSRQNQIKLYYAMQEIINKVGKHHTQITKEEFLKNFPEILIEQESQLSQKIGEIFYHYRLSQIELLAKNETEEQIKEKIGEKPWVVLREILKEAKLPFGINDPSNSGIRDDFKLKLTHQILNEEINFNDLSSGEKVLISLVFYLYNSQEKQVFPKLLLLDEPDAHLHPSMSQQFLNVVKNVLVDKFDVQVFMTTHSPSTVVLAPYESIYEMSREEPKIRKSPSKNHSVSLLTSGLVYVGEGTKYFLVEDNDDAIFYSYIYNQLITDSTIESNIPLVFIPASTKDKSGGKDIVQNWVSKLQESGLVNIIHGLIDLDSGNITSEGVFKIDRYSIENYLADPILVYATLIDKEAKPVIDGLDLLLGEEYKLKTLPNETLQLIVDKIVSLVEPKLIECFPDLNEHEKQLIKVEFLNGKEILYPKWLLQRRGKTIINELYNKIFTSPIINYSSLFKAMRKLNMFTKDIAMKFSEMQNGS